LQPCHTEAAVQAAEKAQHSQLHWLPQVLLLILIACWLT
jgi:hypothetical protein